MPCAEVAGRPRSHTMATEARRRVFDAADACLLQTPSLFANTPTRAHAPHVHPAGLAGLWNRYHSCCAKLGARRTPAAARPARPAGYRPLSRALPFVLDTSPAPAHPLSARESRVPALTPSATVAAALILRPPPRRFSLPPLLYSNNDANNLINVFNQRSAKEGCSRPPALPPKLGLRMPCHKRRKP